MVLFLIYDYLQGQTFTKVGILLQYPVFSHGQLYVAFSRAKAFENIKVYLGDNIENQTMRTKNVVYHEIFD